MSINYTPAQLRAAVRIAPETYRHWKKTLSAFRREAGRGPCFSAGDLIAAAVIRTITKHLGVRVSALATIERDLFKTCNKAPWVLLERGRLVLDVPNGNVDLQSRASEEVADRVVIVIPLSPIVAEIRRELLVSTEREANQELPFPLSAMSSTSIGAESQHRGGG